MEATTASRRTAAVATKSAPLNTAIGNYNRGQSRDLQLGSPNEINGMRRPSPKTAVGERKGAPDVTKIIPCGNSGHAVATPLKGRAVQSQLNLEP